MKLVGRIPVEQLDEERVVNIERKIVAGAHERMAQPLREPRRLLGFAAAAVAAMAAGVVGWKLHRAEVPVAADNESVIAMHGSTLQLADGAITGDTNAMFEIARSGRDVHVKLERGKVELAVTHDPSRVVVVQAGDTEIEDVGTKFSVDYDGGSRVDVKVTEGRVKVKRAGAAASAAADVMVAEGSEWTTTSGVVAMAAPAASANVQPHGDDIEIEPARAPEDVMRAHKATVPDSSSNASRHAGSAAVQAGSDAATKRDEARGGNLRAAILAVPLAPAIAVNGDFAQAVRDAKDDVATKSQIFYAWARATKDDARALKLLEPVLRKDAGVAYLPALWLKLRIVCLQRLDDRCRATAHEYEAANGPYADLAHRILTETQ